MTKQRGIYTPVILSLVLALVTVAPASAEVNFILNPVDPPGVGFNDPTPATPIGGNPGTTLGEQKKMDEDSLKQFRDRFSIPIRPNLRYRTAKLTPIPATTIELLLARWLSFKGMIGQRIRTDRQSRSG